MFIVILLAALAVVGVVATVIDIARPRPTRMPTDWARVREHADDSPRSAVTYR